MSLEDAFGVPDMDVVWCKGIIDTFPIIDGFLKNSIAIVWHFTGSFIGSYRAERGKRRKLGNLKNPKKGGVFVPVLIWGHGVQRNLMIR